MLFYSCYDRLLIFLSNFMLPRTGRKTPTNLLTLRCLENVLLYFFFNDYCLISPYLSLALFLLRVHV